MQREDAKTTLATLLKPDEIRDSCSEKVQRMSEKIQSMKEFTQATKGLELDRQNQ